MVSLCVKRLAVLQSPFSEQVLTTWLPPSSSFPLYLSLFLSQMVGWSVQLWPFTLVDHWDYYLPNTYSANALQHFYHAALTIHLSHTHTYTHLYKHTHTHTWLQAPSLPSLACDQTKEVTPLRISSSIVKIIIGKVMRNPHSVVLLILICHFSFCNALEL